MEKNLPFNLNVKVSSNCFDLYRLGIILTDDRFLPWFIERYICLHMNENLICTYYDIYSSDTLDYLVLFDEVLEFTEVYNKNNIIHTLIDAINNGNYLFLRINQYYLKLNPANYQQEHIPGGICVCGYNEESQTISFSNYNRSNGCWYMDFATFSQLEEAFYSQLKNTREGCDGEFISDLSPLYKFNEPASTARLKNHPINRKIRLPVIHNALKIFLNGGCYLNKLDPSYQRRIGTSIYKGFYEDWYQSIINEKNVSTSRNQEIFHGMRILLENKQGLLYRFQYLFENNYVKIDENLMDKQKQLCKYINDAISYTVKFTFNSKKNCLENAVELLKKAEKLDLEILAEASELLYKTMIASI